MKDMSDKVEDTEMAAASLNGPPDRFDTLISALDAALIVNDKFSFEFIESQCHQEKQRRAQRDQGAIKASASAALLVK